MLPGMVSPVFPARAGAFLQTPRRVPAVACGFILLAVSLSCFAQQGASTLGVESCRRRDATGGGPPCQPGLYEMINEASGELGSPPMGLPAKQAAGAPPESFFEELHEHVTLKARATVAWERSDNIFNTRDNVVSDSLYELFTGAGMNLRYDAFELAGRYDHGFYRYQKSSSSDYDSDKVGVSLSRGFHLLDNKLTVTPRVEWDFTESRLRQGDSIFLRQLASSGGCNASYQATEWASVHLKAVYTYQEVTTDHLADNGTVKLGIFGKFTPFKDYGFHITPSFHYTHEDFRITPEQDCTYTSSVTASWSPLSFLALHVTGSHSANNASDTTSQASYEAFSVTTTLRMLFRW